MHDRRPLLIYGDGPRLPSGLGRIARDLTLRLHNEDEALGITVVQVGVDPPDGWHWQAWPVFGFQPTFHDQGRTAVTLALHDYLDSDQIPIVFMVMDPSRCFDLTRKNEDTLLPAHFWGYFPIDSENVAGRLSGPAAEAVWSCQRVLAYGRYGATVLQRTLQAQAEEKLEGQAPQGQLAATPVSYLPHGLDAHFQPTDPVLAGEQFVRWRQALPRDAWILGCVATNQPRKDLSLLFSVGSLLKRDGIEVGVWLHTDQLTNAWDIGQLAHDFGYTAREVCVSVGEGETILTDAQLCARYTASHCTLAVGLGEGFGYPIVESLACGTPVVHGNFGGGTTLLPRREWLVEPAAWRLESCYAVKRPVLDPRTVAEAVKRAVLFKHAAPQLCEAYCQGAVDHLRWDTLWPRWRRWFQLGLQAPSPARRGRPARSLVHGT